jgi:phage-related tail fiber protein
MLFPIPSGPSPNVPIVPSSTTVTPGTYTNATITVDAQGRVTYATNGLGYVPLQATGAVKITGATPQVISVLSASTVAEGVVQLNANINSNSTTQAATPSAVKAAYDLATNASSNAATALETASSANLAANAALTTSRNAVTLVNQMSGVSGTFTFGTRTMVITNGLITSVT